MFHASCCIHAQVNTLLQKASQLSCISKVATCWLAKSGKATSCVGSTKLASSLSGSHSRTMAFFCATPSWHSLLGPNIAYMFLLSWYCLISQNNLALLTIERFCTPSSKVERKTWGSIWRVTTDVVTAAVSTTQAYTIPTWYRFSIDKMYITCLR